MIEYRNTSKTYKSILGRAVKAVEDFSLSVLLLPVDHVIALKPMIVGGPVESADVMWVLGYGLAATIAGLIALRYAQLAD